MDLFDRLDDVRRRWDVLEHPFYVRWSRGELSREELADYAGQYRHAVVALADATASAAASAGPELRPALERHAAEERAHVALWDGFLTEVGGDSAAAPSEETAKCATAWSGTDAGSGRPLLRSLAALYAIEASQPAISETKRDGLVEHYGFAPGSKGTEYFDLHATRDHEHAAQSRGVLEERLSEADADALVAEAEAVLRANWELLDGVDRRWANALAT